jgi:hypothetical protein
VSVKEDELDDFLEKVFSREKMETFDEFAEFAEFAEFVFSFIRD